LGSSNLLGAGPCERGPKSLYPLRGPGVPTLEGLPGLFPFVPFRKYSRNSSGAAIFHLLEGASPRIFFLGPNFPRISLSCTPVGSGYTRAPLVIGTPGCARDFPKNSVSQNFRGTLINRGEFPRVTTGC